MAPFSVSQLLIESRKHCLFFLWISADPVAAKYPVLVGPIADGELWIDAIDYNRAK
jgi:hypothetical protein